MGGAVTIVGAIDDEAFRDVLVVVVARRAEAADAARGPDLPAASMEQRRVARACGCDADTAWDPDHGLLFVASGIDGAEADVPDAELRAWMANASSA